MLLYVSISEGWAKIKKEAKYNYIDKYGNLLSNKWFDEVGEFKEGYARVEKNGKYNFIDKNGKLLRDNIAIKKIYSLLSLLIIDLNKKTKDIKDFSGEIKLFKNKGVKRNQHGFVVDKKREEVKQKVFEKKGAVCSNCGATENLDVHHILPRNMGGKDVVSNLKVLCRDCHEKLHGYEIDDDTENKGKGLSKKLTLVHKAMDEKLQLYIEYKKFDKNQKDYITSRVIDPMELYYENGRQYLKAYCHLRNQQRTFRISRITKIELR